MAASLHICRRLTYAVGHADPSLLHRYTALPLSASVLSDLRGVLKENRFSRRQPCMLRGSIRTVLCVRLQARSGAVSSLVKLEVLATESELSPFDVAPGLSGSATTAAGDGRQRSARVTRPSIDDSIQLPSRMQRPCRTEISREKDDHQQHDQLLAEFLGDIPALRLLLSFSWCVPGEICMGHGHDQI